MAKSNQTTLEKNLETLAVKAFEKIVLPMVKHEKALESFPKFKNGVLTLEARCHEEDKGQLIGAKQGNFKAIQTLFSLAGAKNGCRFELPPLLPSVVGQRALPKPFQSSNQWPLEEAEALLEEIMSLVLEMEFEIVRENHYDLTYFHVSIDRNEKFTTEISDVVFALSKIIHAIGRMRGRLIFVKEKGS